VRRRRQLFLGQAPHSPPVADSGGDVGMTFRLDNRRRRRRLDFKRVVATAAPVVGGLELDQAAAVTANYGTGIRRYGGRDRGSWNGRNAYGCW
jgi:hypothetical protein